MAESLYDDTAKDDAQQGWSLALCFSPMYGEFARAARGVPQKIMYHAAIYFRQKEI